MNPFQPMNPYDARILQVLAFAMRPLTTSQVSQMANMSYNNTRARLEKLYNTRRIRKNKAGNRIYWTI